MNKPLQPPGAAAETYAAVLLTRFFRTGGRDMLRMMGGSPEAPGGR